MSFYHDSDDERPTRRPYQTPHRLQFGNDSSSDSEPEVVDFVPARRPGHMHSAHSRDRRMRNAAISPDIIEEKTSEVVSVVIRCADESGELKELIELKANTSVDQLLQKINASFGSTFVRSYAYAVVSKWHPRFHQFYPIKTEVFKKTKCFDGDQFEVVFFNNTTTWKDIYWFQLGDFRASENVPNADVRRSQQSVESPASSDHRPRQDGDEFSRRIRQVKQEHAAVAASQVNAHQSHQEPPIAHPKEGIREARVLEEGELPDSDDELEPTPAHAQLDRGEGEITATDSPASQDDREDGELSDDSLSDGELPLSQSQGERCIPAPPSLARDQPEAVDHRQAEVSRSVGLGLHLFEPKENECDSRMDSNDVPAARQQPTSSSVVVKQEPPDVHEEQASDPPPINVDALIADISSTASAGVDRKPAEAESATCAQDAEVPHQPAGSAPLVNQTREGHMQDLPGEQTDAVCSESHEISASSDDTTSENTYTSENTPAAGEPHTVRQETDPVPSASDALQSANAGPATINSNVAADGNQTAVLAACRRIVEKYNPVDQTLSEWTSPTVEESSDSDADSESESSEDDDKRAATAEPPARANGDDESEPEPCDESEDEVESSETNATDADEDDEDGSEEQSEEQQWGLRKGVSLRQHQKSGVDWMLSREAHHTGGILADEMGLGKSLEAIVLILRSMPTASQRSDASYGRLEPVKKNRLARSTATLIIAPASVIYQWEAELKKFVRPGILSCYVYYHGHKITNPDRLALFDVVITSYETVAYEVHPSKTRRRSGKISHALSNIYWQRIILDEAHYIKALESRRSRACCSLEASLRWCLTGTPVHKDLQDLFALAYFIRVPGYADKRQMEFLIDTSRQGVAERWNELTKDLLLRRMKGQKCSETGQPLVELPKRNVETVEVSLEGPERQAYDTMMECAEEYLKEWLANKKYLKRHYVHSTRWKWLMRRNIFFRSTKINQLFLRCRQAAVHFALTEDAISKTDMFAAMANDIVEVGTSDNILRQRMSQKIAINQSEFNSIYKRGYRSAKMEALMTRVEGAVAKGDKCVIVTQWTSLFKVIMYHLKEAGISFTTVSGDVPTRQRQVNIEFKRPNQQKNVEAFNSADADPQVMILSLCAGGTGLNLVGGNHLFILDLHWNPSLEAQACDRIHRMGQQKEVFIYKLVALNTVEEGLLLKQDQKTSVIQAILSSAIKTGSGRIKPEHYPILFGFKNLSTAPKKDKTDYAELLNDSSSKETLKTTK